MSSSESESECLFCRIASGAAPAHVVFGDDVAVGFLDIRPLFAGHTLIVARRHHVTLADLPSELIEPLFARAQRMSRIMETELGAEGSFVAMNNTVSQSVPHLHIHVVPRTKGDGLRGFFWPRTKYETDDEAAGMATRLARAWNEAVA